MGTNNCVAAAGQSTAWGRRGVWGCEVSAVTMVGMHRCGAPAPLQQHGELASLLCPHRAAVYWDDAELARELVIKPLPHGDNNWCWSGERFAAVFGRRFLVNRACVGTAAMLPLLPLSMKGQMHISTWVALGACSPPNPCFLLRCPQAPSPSVRRSGTLGCASGTARPTILIRTSASPSRP